MAKKSELEKLFDEWRLVQGKEEEYNWKGTGISKESFTEDGIVNEEIWDNLQPEKKRVLYLFGEATVSKRNRIKRTDTGALVDEGEFWFKKCVGENHIGGKLFRRIAAMQRIIQKQEELSDEEALQQVAYMYINKRGGGAWKDVNKYAGGYHEYIKKEICIINPDIIVCCETYWYLIDIVCNLYNADTWNSRECFYLENVGITIDEYKCTTSIINMYHPSGGMSDDVYIDCFLKRFSGKIGVDTNLHREKNDIKQDNYLKHEREIIDYCQKKLEQYIEREYYEDGSFRPTDADKLLDRELRRMMEHKTASKYASVKKIIDLLKKEGYEIKRAEEPQKNIMLWLFCLD